MIEAERVEARDAQRLMAQAAASMSLARLGPPDRAALDAVVRDYLACTLAGAETEAAARLRDAVLREAEGASRVVGRPAGAPAPLAAFANAHACHVLEFDDVHVGSIYHPGAPTISAVLAVADRDGLSPEDAAAGILAGYEIGIRVGAAAGKAHYRRHHTTGTVGCVGAAAGAARAMGLDAEATASAIGHAATQAAGLWAFRDDSSDSKPVHAAHAAMVGVISADMARAGLQGPLRAVEGSAGLLATLGGDPAAAVLTAELDASLKIGEVTLKAYRCCGHTHSGIEAAQELNAERLRAGIEVSDIAEIVVRTYGAAVEVAGLRAPRTEAQSCFSYSHIVATLVARGSLDRAFTREGIADAAVRNLERKVRLVHDSGLDAAYPTLQPVHLTLIATSGEELHAEGRHGAGSPFLPMTPEQQQAKLRLLVGERIGELDEIAARLLGPVSAWF